MFYAVILRFLRRKIVLGFIFIISFTYCIVNLLRESKLNENEIVISKRSEPFIWRTLQQTNEEVNNSSINCRNSVQGKNILVDDRGYVCSRQLILSNGCCNISSISNELEQYSCETCDISTYCCSTYEYCVSCCLNPQKKPILEIVLDKAIKENNVLFLEISDHFELCLAKCRTNSKSVQHENSYKDPINKYCYGHDPPSSIINR